MHWFVEWLNKSAEEYLESANELRKPNGGTMRIGQSPEGSAERALDLELAEEHEKAAAQLEHWAWLVDDMTRCGLEKEALAYYDARSSVLGSLPSRPNSGMRHFKTILGYLGERRRKAHDEYEILAIEEMQTTIRNLFLMGMHEAAITYYMRARELYEEYELSDLGLFGENDACP